MIDQQGYSGQHFLPIGADAIAFSLVTTAFAHGLRNNEKIAKGIHNIIGFRAKEAAKQMMPLPFRKP